MTAGHDLRDVGGPRAGHATVRVFDRHRIHGRTVYQLRGKSEDLDGMMVFSPQGKPLADIALPERCADLTFGGPKNNRLYMASCDSLHALYVEAHGAT